jgi:hypothetical protein
MALTLADPEGGSDIRQGRVTESAGHRSLDSKVGAR